MKDLIVRTPHTKAKVGLVTGGLGTYWPQFPNLLQELEKSSRSVFERLQGLSVEVVDGGFVSNAEDSANAAERLRRADCDLIIVFLATYLTASMVLPIAQRTGSPILVVSLQPEKHMDHERFETGDWLAYCGQCPVPEIGNVFRRAGIPFRSVTGWMGQDSAWEKIERWVNAARVSAQIRRSRHGLMGHLYPGMLDVSTDPLLVSSTFGSHIEILEFDDLRVRVEAVPQSSVDDRVSLTQRLFEIDETVAQDDLAWAAKVSVALDQLVEDFDLDSLSYYHRGLDGEVHERLGAGMILGASLLTAAGVPTTGEYELRTTIAQLITDISGGGGSFCEIQALNFVDDVVEMGHDGPAHLEISSRRPLLRGLGQYHGKRGWGVSVEFDVKTGPVTLLGLGEDEGGKLSLVASEGIVTPGPLMKIGNTTSRVDFACDPGEWVDEWSNSGVGHHWSLSVGHRSADYRAVADLLGIQFRKV